MNNFLHTYGTPESFGASVIGIAVSEMGNNSCDAPTHDLMTVIFYIKTTTAEKLTCFDVHKNCQLIDDWEDKETRFAFFRDQFREKAETI